VLDASGNAAFAAAVTVAGNAVVTGTLQANGVTGSVYPLVLGTAQASTSGTAIDFTGIPSWARRVTVMFNGVSTNGTSVVQVQIGAGSVTTSGYAAAGGSSSAGAAPTVLQPTTGFPIVADGNAAYTRGGSLVLLSVGSNIWAASGVGGETSGGRWWTSGGSITLSGTLDRVRITTVNGTDAFDAGSINIMWE
jgi:hypothetical protein